MLPADTARAAILGSPLNPGKQPSPSGVVRAFEQMDARILANSAGALVVDTYSDLSGLSSPAANIMVWVMSGSQAGVYQNTGTSGSPSWTKRADLPYGVIKAINVGAGSANAIVATSAIPVPSADGAALIILPIVATNDASPVTVAFNGGTALTIKTNTGNDIAIGGLQSGMLAVGFKSSTTFRLISDQVASAIIAQAEAHADAAEGFRDEAEAFKNAAEAAAAAAAQKFFPVRVLDDEEGDPATDYEHGDVIDGVTLATGDIVLRATSGGGIADGVYVVAASGAASRHPSFDAYDDLPGSYFSVMEGDDYADTLWRVTSDKGGTLGSTDVVIGQFSSGGGGGGGSAAASLAALQAIAFSDGQVIELTASGRAGKFLDDAADWSATIAGTSVTSTSIDSGAGVITSTAHGLKTGQAVMPTTSVNGLTAGALYYAIRVDADTFSLASSRANALAGTEFNLTGTTNFTMKVILDDLQGVYVIPTGKALDGSEGVRRRLFDGENYDPRWFGAVCDAATDDWPAFFTMIALMPTGKCIRLPIGLCGVSRTLEIAKDISIVGVSKSRSGFMALGFSSGAFILDWLGTTTDRIQNIVLAEFTLRSDNQLAVGMRLTWVNKSEFRNLFFYNLRHGVTADNAWSNLWSGFSTFAIAFTTYRDLDEGNNVTFRGCQFRGEVGYWASGNVAGITFENCDFEDITSTSGAGIRLAPTAGKRVTGVMVSGGYWEMIKGRAIQCDGDDADSVNGLTVTGAYFYGGHVNKFSSTAGQAQHAISLGNTAGFSIVANYFFDWEIAAFLVSPTTTLNGIISDNITRQTAALLAGDLDDTVESTRNRVI